MSVNRIALILAALMCAASVGAVMIRPGTKVADRRPVIDLAAMVPRHFGNWHEEPQPVVQVVNPQTKQLLDKLYSQILTRTYVSTDGYRIMLSLAYGNDQRDELQAHKPEVCYPSQGFTLQSMQSGPLPTKFGSIFATRLMTSMGQRREPVTYWFTIGDSAIQNKIQKRLVELRYGLTGEIPDGLLFRVSSIDPDQGRANQVQDQFVNQLLDAVSPSDRLLLSGLGKSKPI